MSDLIRFLLRWRRVEAGSFILLSQSSSPATLCLGQHRRTTPARFHYLPNLGGFTMNRTIRNCLLLAALLASVVGVVPVAPQPAEAQTGTWDVSNSGSDANACNTPAAPCATIQAAIDRAASGDTIHIAVGTYTSNNDGVVNLSKNLTLFGGWNSDFTASIGLSTVDGQATRRGIVINACGNWGASGFVQLQRLLITNGFGSVSGGGIYIMCAGARVDISNSVVSNNRAGDQFSSGGGGGGGLYAGGVVTITNSTISGNSLIGGFSGAGIHNLGKLTIINSTIADNTQGEAIFNLFYNAILDIRSSTITGNPTGIHNVGGSVTIANSIVANSAWVDCYSNSAYLNSNVTSLGYNLIERNSNCTITTEDLVNVDPRLDLLRNNGGLSSTSGLANNSPAINTGNPAGCTGILSPLLVDQRGASRVGRCDIGAFEANLLISKSV
ncbi:MAG: choice-of-anchor Q domain-containing protein, partial [Anaerolineales bacterium]